MEGSPESSEDKDAQSDLDSFVKPSHFLSWVGYAEDHWCQPRTWLKATTIRAGSPETFVKWSTMHIYNLNLWNASILAGEYDGGLMGVTTIQGIPEPYDISTDENAGSEFFPQRELHSCTVHAANVQKP